MRLNGKGKTFRVVQWATGNIGTRSLRAIIQHPYLTLVGLYVHTLAKVGRDAGELCGLEPVGIHATNDIDEIIRLKPDCVLYAQQGCDLGDICRILESGANVVTTRVEFLNPRIVPNDVRERLEQACERGQTSIYCTGSSPGFITEALPLVLLSIQRRLDGLTIDEYADLTNRNSPELLFDVMGFGQPPAEFGETRLSDIKGGFAQSLHLIAEAIGMPLDSIEVKGELGLARNDARIDAGLIKAGTIAAQRISITGIRGNKPLLSFRANWYCTKDIDVPWQLGETGWRVVLQGDAPLDITILNAVAADQIGLVAPNKTANRAVNAVAYVCEAPVGIRTTIDLPQIIPFLGQGEPER